MLSRRLASAAVIITVLVALIGLDFHWGQEESMARPGLILSAIAVAVAILSANELVSLLQKTGPQLSSVKTAAIAGLAVALCCMPVFWREDFGQSTLGTFGWSMIALAFAIGITLLFEIVSYSGDRSATGRVAASVLIHSYLLLLFGFLVAHRLLRHDNSAGLIALLTLMTTVKMSDAAAYFVGKAVGTLKMAPLLSPGKTVQGALGSIAGAWLGAMIVVYIVAPLAFTYRLEVPVWWVLIYGVGVGVAGIIGDLAISLLKRDADLKDSSSWLPGLGGVLDVTDSLALAAPVSYLFWVMLAVGN